MPTNLKEILDADAARAIADDLHRAWPALDRPAFVADCLAGLDALELKARAWQIAAAMHRHLPQPFPLAAEVLGASLGAELPQRELSGTSTLRYLPHGCFVEKYGVDHFEEAMAVQYQLTKRFTAEFSIRAFLERYPGPTLERLRIWATDENVHVRRLVSEGTRPRLPWARRLRAYQADPTPVVELLELLKDDPERYVQRSVANNLNDIGKDHPALVTEICRRWLEDAPAGRRWIVGHALRSLVKKGDPQTLEALGFGGAPQVEIGSPTLTPRQVRLGEELRFSFELTSTGRTAQELLVDFAVHFVGARGASRRKVFKLRRVGLGPLETAHLAGTVSFAEMTTRKHYPGRHRIEVLVNGQAYPLASFDVLGSHAAATRR